MWSPDKISIAWSENDHGKNNFSHPNHFVFLFLPWVLLALIFVFRRFLSSRSDKTKFITTASLGAFAIIWELWFDVASIVNRDANVSASSAAWTQFVDGFDFCRMNTYIVGVFLILQRRELIKWVAATALFGGYSTLIDHYSNTASFHSLITHAVILTSFAAVGATMWGSNYKVRNLIHSHLFNWALVAFMYFVVNNEWGGHAGELTKDRMGDNVMVGFAPFPVNMFLWILSVMFLEWMYFIVFRLIWWRTYAKKDSFGQTFKVEWPIDKVEWYGFKLWGKNSFYERSLTKSKALHKHMKAYKK